MPIISSLLDTDFYKLTMQQAVLHRFPNTSVAYEFKCRNGGGDFLAPLADEIRREVAALSALRFGADELEYLESLGLFKSDYVDFLRDFQLNAECVKVANDGGDLGITISGPWRDVILFETPVLAIVNELHYKNKDNGKPDFETALSRLESKIRICADNADFMLAEFGTRRRRSHAWQERLVRILKDRIPGNLIGTSNVLFAMRFALPPIGTMAHEWLQAHQALVNLEDSQRLALENWFDEYGSRLGIALSDVVGMDAFLQDFGLDLARRYNGCRQDSGDPFLWCDKMLAHYEKLGVDSRTKTAVFSDSLDFPKAQEILSRFRDRIKIVFGIGTNLTNDFGDTPLQTVIKMTGCDGRPVAKLSDSPGKEVCNDENLLQSLRRVFKINP